MSELKPFKWFVLENFPFIEEDFDALTNWQLFCKIGDEINKIINSQNALGNEVQEYEEKFIALQDFVNNYFDNLDVQEEINTKLDDMAESGELAEIISLYLNAISVQGFNTVADIKEAEALSENSFAYVYGHLTAYDGKGAFYKIREILNTDVVDNFNIIALDNSDNLVAVRISNYYIDKVAQDLSDLDTNVNNRIDTTNTTVTNNKNEQKIINSELKAKADSARITKRIRNINYAGGTDNRGQTIPAITIQDITINEDYVELVFGTPGNIYYNPYSGVLSLELTVKSTSQIPANTKIIYTPMTFSTSSTYKEINRAFGYVGSTTQQYTLSNGRIYKTGELACSSIIPTGTVVNIQFTCLYCSGLGGFFASHINDIDTVRDALITKVESWEGQFYYSNQSTGRLFPETSGVTDCSGLCWALYNQAGNFKLAPTLATEFANELAVVTEAQAGEDLDLSLLKKGDLICWYNNYDDTSQDPDTYFHVVIYDGEGGYWESTSTWNSPQSGVPNYRQPMPIHQQINQVNDGEYTEEHQGRYAVNTITGNKVYSVHGDKQYDRRVVRVLFE